MITCLKDEKISISNNLYIMHKNPSASIIIIGDEILSGRTLDTNTQFLAKTLTSLGIDLIETCTIKDDMSAIIETVQEFTNKYDYVFTSGGIGPTHDDITSYAISKAFGLEYVLNKEAYDILEKLYATRGQKVTNTREKMAWMPEGARLITYSPPSAPGFIIDNVYVLAGVPYIFEAMVESFKDKLKKGKILKSKNIDVFLGESFIAEAFENLQKKYPDILMGSYPFIKEGFHGTSLVIRSSDENLLDKAYSELQEIINQLSAVNRRMKAH